MRLSEAATASRAAARQKAYRKRRNRGLRCVQTMLGPKESDWLVDNGYLAQDDREIEWVVSDAVGLLIQKALK
jgi:hypothetical protein